MEKVVPFRTGYGSGLCAAWYDGSFLFVLFRLSSGADGHVSGTVDYDVFGKPVMETGVFAGSAGGSGGISALVFAYAGKPYDSVTGLSDYGFRDYAPTLARFTTVDPIRDGSNWYAYCNSDPVNYVDAWGERPLTTEEITFATKILGTSINGTTIDYAGIEVVETVPPRGKLWVLAFSLKLPSSIAGMVVDDMQDPTRGASLPGGIIYLPGNTSSSLARIIHEIFHQCQYASNQDAFARVVNEQIAASMNGSDPYDYNSNNIGQITTLWDITTIEGQAQYIEDFIDLYLYQKGIQPFDQDTKDRANVLYNSGIRSQAVCEVRNS